MHGFTVCKAGPMPWSRALTLDDVLAGCYAFLQAHPTETVLFAAKYEHGDASVSQVQQTLDTYLQKNPEAWLVTDTMPTLGEARGRLVLLRRWEVGGGPGRPGGLSLGGPEGPGRPLSEHRPLRPGELPALGAGPFRV